MSSNSTILPRRERFADAAILHERRAQRLASHESFVLDLLLAQDGSTTRLCETIARGRIEVLLVHQAVTTEVPASVRQRLPGEQFIERLTSLVAHGQVMMDNLSYTALHGLEPDIDADLRAGVLPIGHLLARWWVRRERMGLEPELTRRLWDAVGQPDPDASRCYAIVTPQGPRMVIAETFRAGMLMDLFS